MRLDKFFLALLGGSNAKVSVGEISSTSALITWDGSDRAQIEVNRLDARSRTIHDQGRHGAYQLDQLVAGAQYRARVVEDGGEPQTLEFNTKPNKLKEIRASKFLNPTASAEPSYGAVLYWTPPEGNVDGYIIDVYPPHGQIKSPVLQKNGEVVEDPTQPRRVVTGLVPGEAYNFTVKSTSGREISDQEVLETRIPPETPGEIDTLEVGSRSAILDWQKEHRGYLDGFYIETSPPDGEVANPRDSSEKQRELVGLKPGKRYGVKVHSTAYGLLSFKPSERSIITLPEAPLGDLIVISQNPVNVTLSWTPPDGEAQMYQITYYPTNSDARKLKELSINSTISLTNMDPGTEYNFEIETISNGIHSDPMVSTLITTPDEIEDLKIVDKDFTSASFAWEHNSLNNTRNTDGLVDEGDELSGDALFVVSYNPTTPNSWPESPFLTREPFAAVDGLVPGKKYTFHVKAVIDNVESKKKSVSTILPVPEQPTNVVIDEVTSNSMHISWESPHDDAQYIVNVMDTAGSLADFPLTVDDKEVTIDNLKEGETYKVTVATTVDGYTTDKHATQVETYADTQDTMLFPLDLDETTDEAQEKFNAFAAYVADQVDGEVAIDVAVVDTVEMNGDKFGVLSVSIFAQPSVLSSDALNGLYEEFIPSRTPTQSSFSAPIDTSLNECRSKNNVCSVNAECTDSTVLYQCQCAANYTDVTEQMDLFGQYQMAGQACVANPDHCVRTNWRFSRAGYIVVRRRMPAVEEMTVCFKLTLDTRKMTGILTTYRQEDSVLSMRADDRGNLAIKINDELMHVRAETFVQGEPQKMCLTASNDVITFYVNGRPIASQAPVGSVALVGGGKVQIGRDPECSRRCEREIGNLDATVEDYTIWSKALTTEEVDNFTNGMCINNAELTLEQDVVETSKGKKNVQSDSPDELFNNEELGDLFDLGRRFMTTASPTNVPRFIDSTQADFKEPVFNQPMKETIFDPLNDASTHVETIIGDFDAGDDLETFCKPDNMTVRVKKSFIDAYEQKYGAISLEDSDCGRQDQGEYYVWVIAPDLLGCGTAIELSDTHVTFVNALSTIHNEANEITAVNGIIFGNQLTEKQTTKVSMSVSCTFPLDYTVTADYPFLPQINMQVFKFNVSGHGEFSAVMQLYEDETYESAYTTVPEIKEEEMLNVGISLIESQDPTIRVTTLQCWATPEQDPHGELQHYLIQEGCAVDGVLDGTLAILENGQSKMAKWQGAVFQFVGYDEVWLHCDIKVCFNDQDCLPSCGSLGRRKRRDIIEDIVTISASQPVRRFEPEHVIIENSATYQSNRLIIGLIAGVCALTLLLLNAVGLIIFRRNNAKLAAVNDQ